jgi:hypothetical protein
MTQWLTLPICLQGFYTVAGVFPASLGRWLRVEGKLLTEVPWLFAALTGIDRETMTDKVTVYWDEVPGATGYRVRWGNRTRMSLSEPGNVGGRCRRCARQYTSVAG